MSDVNLTRPLQLGVLPICPSRLYMGKRLHRADSSLSLVSVGYITLNDLPKISGVECVRLVVWKSVREFRTAASILLHGHSRPKVDLYAVEAAYSFHRRILSKGLRDDNHAEIWQVHVTVFGIGWLTIITGIYI